LGRGPEKFIVEVEFPLEPFNTYVRKGTIGEKIGEVLGAVKPEVIYFTDSGVGRGAVMIVELDSANRAPHVTEPFMLTFDASVRTTGLQWHQRNSNRPGSRGTPRRDGPWDLLRQDLWIPSPSVSGYRMITPERFLDRPS
jgi:hypothetical protein